MSLTEKIASKDTAIREKIAKLHPYFLTFAYTYGRKIFLNLLSKDKPKDKFLPSEKFQVKLWDIDFACGLFNAAGMFKKGESYFSISAQGAGAYLAGTTTAKAIRGNSRILINHPFIPYPFSHSASN